MNEQIEKWPPSFSLDGPRIMALLTGDRFYSSADAALREAVLNAIDACGRRQAADGSYHPGITVTFDEGTRTLTIADNGDGMDQHDVSGLFARIGASASRAMEKTGQGQYEAVGEFGIGVVSYFLVCARFEIHTVGASGEQVGLAFTTAMFDTKTPAEVVPCLRTDRGTTLVIYATEPRHFDLLLGKLAYWVRDVPYLTASSSARGSLAQGGRRSHVAPIPVPARSWIERAELGPPMEITFWRMLDGAAHVDVLYRGVFIQELKIDQLWGIEGSLHVNPKHFKPKLNRESFIAEVTARCRASAGGERKRAECPPWQTERSGRNA